MMRSSIANTSITVSSSSNSYTCTDSFILKKELPDYFNDEGAIKVLRKYIKQQKRLLIIDLVMHHLNKPYLLYSLPSGKMFTQWLKEERVYGNIEKIYAVMKQLRMLLAHSSMMGIPHGRIDYSSIYVDDNHKFYLLDSVVVGAITELVSTKQLPLPMLNTESVITATPRVCFGGKATEQDVLFNLSVIAYQLFTQQHPFAGKSSIQALVEKTHPKRLAHFTDSQWQGLSQSLTYQQKNITDIKTLFDVLFTDLFNNTTSKKREYSVTSIIFKGINKMMAILLGVFVGGFLVSQVMRLTG